MMWFFAILVVLVMGGVAALAAGRGAPMSDAYDDRAFGRGHLEVHVGEASGKLLDLALAPAQALDRVQRC